MNTESIWEKVSNPPAYPKLEENLRTDVVIIGAGITGMTAALEVAKAGLKTVVIEAYRAGDGTTGYSTGNLYIPTQPYYQNIQAKFGTEVVRVIAHSRREALDYIERLVSEHNIDCHFSRRPGYMFTGGVRQAFLEKEVETLKEAGVDVSYTQDFPWPEKAKRVAYFPNQARFNPKTYIDGLARAFTKADGQLFEHSPVIKTEEKGSDCIVHTARHTITARTMIMATHTPKGIHMMQVLTAPYRSYVVGATLQGDRYPNGHFWNVDPDGFISSTHAIYGDELDMLTVAGGHHKTGQAVHKNAEANYENIESYIRKHFTVKSVRHRWSAQHYQAADDIPYIGFAHRGTKCFYVAGGYFADGLTFGTVAGQVLASSIRGKNMMEAATYDATRFTPLASAPSFFKENLNVFGEYLRSLPGVHDATDYSAIKTGEGGVVEVKGKKLAAYRDEKGSLHVVSAVCTHLKCVVRFNNAEKTWDCPCHGSRFALDGSVLEGPALSPLKVQK